MEKLSLSSTPSPTIPRPFLSHPVPVTRARRKVSFSTRQNPKKFSVFASKNDDYGDNINQWDLMELKFGQMIGEDPKLTLAKILARKANPDASFIEIEKNFHKNKGKLVEVKEVPFDVPGKLGSVKAKDGLKLVKPVPKKGIKVGDGENRSKLPEINRPNDSIRNKVDNVTRSSVPNVILRKPSVYNEKDDEMDSSTRLRIQPNLSLSMRTEPVKEKFSGMTLLKRPEPTKMAEDHGDENENNLMTASAYSGLSNGASNDFESDLTNGRLDAMNSSDGMTLSQKPKAIMHKDIEGTGDAVVSNGTAGMEGNFVEPEYQRDLISKQDEQWKGSQTGMQHLEQTDGFSGSESSVKSVLLGRPKRLDHSMKEMSYSVGEGAEAVHPESEGDRLLLSRPMKEIEEADWKRVEQRFNAGDRVEVELISCSPRGFVVSFGSLIGFLPYRNLAAKWKFLAFESWLRRNGLNPSKYRQNLGIIGSEDFLDKSTSHESSSSTEFNQKAELKLTVDMELEDLLRIYDQEKIQYLSSYVGQHIKVNIQLADKNSRKLIFSMRPKEKEEIVEKKRSLMAKLSIGDVVKCRIKKITYFGIFVEVEGVPALIHQSEVSWDATLNPATYLKTGQIAEAKVHQLDFALERIFLSLKEITPDPLNEALECIVGNSSFNGGLEAAQADSEWAEVDSLVKALQEIDGVQTVNKGRFFLSPGLAPTFQVYMASMFENQYKLLARSGNRVQEVIVQASLDKEEIKSAILKCTNRVDV